MACILDRHFVDWWNRCVWWFALAFYDRWLDEHRGKVGKKELKKIQADLSELRMDLVELKKSVSEIREFITDLYIQKYDE